MIAFCQFVGNLFEKVVTEGTADALQKSSIDALLLENLVDVGAGAANLCSKPSGAAPFFPKFFPDAITYMHTLVPRCRAMPRVSLTQQQTVKQKKRGQCSVYQN